MQKAKKMLTGSVLALIIVFFMVFYTDSHKMLVYGENLDETAVTVDGEALSLEDIAFYVAYEETMIEKQAENLLAFRRGCLLETVCRRGKCERGGKAGSP